jgi:hypothetical protein
MIKTLFASVCVLACCMGNEYPAKAYSCNYSQTQAYQDCVNNQADAEYETRRQLEEQRQEIDDQIRLGTYRSF